MTKAWITAFRWLATLGFSLVLAIVSWAGSDGVLSMLNLNPVRTVWFTLLAGALVAVVPLSPSFGILGDTFVRARRDRVVRVCGVLMMLVGQAAPVTLGDAPPAAVKWFAILGALSIVSVVLLGDLGWIITLTVGSLTVLLEHAWSGFPVSQALDSIPGALPLVLCFVTALIYVHRGPKLT